MRSFHHPGRSPVFAQHAMAATSHPLSTATAIDVLRQGGNAVDAAISAAAVQCVVEPAMTGIGGDCFAMVRKPDGQLIALNASGFAPEAASLEKMLAFGLDAIPRQSPHAVTVPGAIDGWATLARDHGTRPLGDLLQPAIRYAADGYPVAPRVQLDWSTGVERLSADEGASRHYLIDGNRAPRVGEVVRLPALARSLETLAAEGRDAFYEGALAHDMVGTLQAKGGVHTLDDFAAQRSDYVDPISHDYHGLTIHEMPPNNQGVIALMILRILERIGRISEAADDPLRYHVMIEAARQAYAVRDALLADPRHEAVDVDHLLSDAMADELAGRIDLSMRREDVGPVPKPGGSDTVYLSVVDQSGMAVSFINSLFSDFGSNIATVETGILFHNRGQGFVLEPGHPNAIAPRKRPLHTLVPAIATENGALALSFGVMGGQFQAVGHAYVISNMRDYGMDPQEALDFPRAFFEGETVELEASIPQSTRNALKAFGHPISVRDKPWGGGQIIAVDGESGVLIGASDARKDGAAIGY